MKRAEKIAALQAIMEGNRVTATEAIAKLLNREFSGRVYTTSNNGLYHRAGKVITHEAFVKQNSLYQKVIVVKTVSTGVPLAFSEKEACVRDGINQGAMPPLNSH